MDVQKSQGERLHYISLSQFFSRGTYLQLYEHADGKRIHSFKFGMEIAKRLNIQDLKCCK